MTSQTSYQNDMESQIPSEPEVYSKNVHVLELEGKQIFLVGTAHVSQESVEEVQNVILQEKPDSVCVELCAARYESLCHGENWKSMDIFKVVKENKTLVLLANLLMSSFQKKLGDSLGVRPGEEMLQASIAAEEVNAELVLADRDVRITLQRTWRKLSLFTKSKVMVQMLSSIFVQEEITKEEIENLKQEDTLSQALEELGETAPQMKAILIDERDQFLAENIRTAPGDCVVAIVGAGHVPGIKEELSREHDLQRLQEIPPVGKLGVILKWGIPSVIISLIVYGFFNISASASWEMVQNWFWINGALSALGAALAFGHPLTIITAFVAAPFTSLNPAVAAGWVAGLVETFVHKPQVRDFENLSDDVQHLRGFWKNKITRILLVVIFANLGSSIGTLLGGIAVASLL